MAKRIEDEEQLQGMMFPSIVAEVMDEKNPLKANNVSKETKMGSKDRYIVGENRYQLSMFPESLDDMIGDENPVRAINAIIDKMDIQSMNFKYANPKTTGRKAYNPVDMIKLYLYCYFNGIRSSRKIERECGRNIEVMWLIGKMAPDFKTIASFRKDNKKGIRKIFTTFNMLCAQIGLMGKEMVAIDGTKIKACNSQDKYFTQKKVESRIKHFEKQATLYMELLDANDKTDNKNPSTRFNTTELKEKLKEAETKLEEYKEMEKTIKETGPIAQTDPDSRIMKVKNHGKDICHNVQVAVESENRLVVAADVTSNACDKGELYKMAWQAKNILKVNKLLANVDKGYYVAAQFRKCEQRGIRVIAPKVDAINGSGTEYPKAMFTYVGEKNAYKCPRGHYLYQKKRMASSKSTDVSYANSSVCKDCPDKKKCTKCSYRTIKECQDQRYADTVDELTKQNPDIVAKRKTIVEHVFGCAKRNDGFTYFLTCGHENVLAEVRLYFTAFNIKRVINILGVKQILALCS